MLRSAMAVWSKTMIRKVGSLMVVLPSVVTNPILARLHEMHELLRAFAARDGSARFETPCATDLGKRPVPATALWSPHGHRSFPVVRYRAREAGPRALAGDCRRWSQLVSLRRALPPPHHARCLGDRAAGRAGGRPPPVGRRQATVRGGVPKRRAVSRRRRRGVPPTPRHGRPTHAPARGVCARQPS